MKKIEDIFGISIKNEEYFNRALTHSSYTKEKQISYLENYERLEFLGDAVLKLAISDILYKKYPEYTEGELSKIRSIIVSDSILSRISKDIGLSELIVLGKHEVKQGLKELESIKACVLEAILGAYYLDGKFSELLCFIEKTFSFYIVEIDENFEKYNAKAMLQEYTQSKTKEVPIYCLINESGPAHNKVFTIEVSYQGEVIACGEGKTKKEAEQKCAYAACEKLGVIECQK